MGWWIFGGVVVAIVIGMLALDWITAGRAGRRLSGIRGRSEVESGKLNWGMVQQQFRQAARRRGDQSS